MLYKYFPSDRVDVLEKLKIRFSPLQSLNDPFEQAPLIVLDKINGQTISEFSGELDEFWFHMDPSDKTEEHRKSFEKEKGGIS